MGLAGFSTRRWMSWVRSLIDTTVVLMVRAGCTTISSGSGIWTVQASVTQVWQAST